MALPINIDDLINARTVESVRIEFKKGWNPEEIAHTMCAFANDINEYGGGYIVIGIEEHDGQPVLPPIGLQTNQIDKIQKEFISLCHDVKPNIFPLIEPIEFMGKYIIIIWIITGEERPYTVPSTLGTKGQRKIYVRQGSTSIPANIIQEKKLRELSVNLPFDDIINQVATIDDLDLGLIQAYLQETKSTLYEESLKLSISDIAVKMRIARGPKENVRPLNIALLMFSKQPQRFFPGCITNLVEFNDEDGTDIGVSKTFSGPVHIQIRDILNYLRSSILKTFINKSTSKAEHETFLNYPFLALREAVVNAFHHRGYDDPMANEIRIYKIFRKGVNKIYDPRQIEIRSYPGPMSPIDEQALAQLNIVDRRYRNIRLGDMLKQLGLVEKYATGIPQIVNALNKNGSPLPILSTDKDRIYFLTILKIHESTPLDSDILEPIEHVHLSDLHQNILEKLLDEPCTESEIMTLFPNLTEDNLHYISSHGLVDKKNVNNSSVFYVTKKGREILKNTF